MEKKTSEGLNTNLEGSRGFFGKITGDLVNRICNLERAEGFMCKIGGPRLICK
jgi:hypothetical protein